MAVGEDSGGHRLSKRLLLASTAHGGQIALLAGAAGSSRASRSSLAVLPCFLWERTTGAADARWCPNPNAARGSMPAWLEKPALMLPPGPRACRKPSGRWMASSMAGEAWGWSRRWETPPPGWSLEAAVPTAWLTRISPPRGDRDAAGANAQLVVKALFKHAVSRLRQLREGLLSSSWPPGIEPFRPMIGYSCDLH